MRRSTILISGLGVAGPTLAYWLKAAGFEPTIVERAPRPRRSGYVIDFWGLGYDVAERMGLISEIDRTGYHVRELRIVDDRGRRLAGFGTRALREISGGRYVTIGRSDLSALLFEKVERDVETAFGDEIVALDQHGDGVDVGFKHAARRRFDLVIGADGLHSAVRRLAFGSQDRFENRLGHLVAAFEARGYRPRDENVFVIYSEPAKMLARFAMHDDRTLFLFVFAADPEFSGPTFDLAAQKAIVREWFGGGHWECPRILAELDQAQDLYLDRVSQIKLDRWSRGRVALVGDAAFCVSILAGQGAALAMTSAYVLAGELAKTQGRYEDAFRQYEALLKPFISSKQRIAERFARVFAPRTRWGLFLRNRIINACAIPGLARLTFARGLVDALSLPNYAFVNAVAKAFHQIAFLTFWMALGLSAFESVSAEECLTTPQQLVEKKVGDRWKELHQKDNQPLFLTISAGQGNELQFVGKKPDGSTWISGAMSICSYAGNIYQVKLDRIDKAPLFVGPKLRGMSDTIPAGSSHLKFGAGKHCGNPDPCIEFGKE